MYRLLTLALAIVVGAALPAPVVAQQSGPILDNVLTVRFNVPQHPIDLRLEEVEAVPGTVMSTDVGAMVYGLEGEHVVARAGQGPVRVGPGEAWYLPPDVLHTHNFAGPARFLLFSITTAGNSAPSIGHGEGVTRRVLYASPGPVTGLEPGPHELTVQQASWTPNAPPNPPHSRTGVGVYYILSGTFTIEIDGQAGTDVPAGSINYEDKELVHRNQNRTDAPTRAVFFTLTPSGQQVTMFQMPPPALPDAKLRVYGAGGPLGPMREALEAFKARTGTDFTITAGPTGMWLDDATANGDLVFFGGEYVMDAFADGRTYQGERRLATEGLIMPESRTSLYTRPSGILVRPDNPRGITSMRDLARPGVKILTVHGAGQTGVWEEMAARAGILSEVRANIVTVAADGADAIRAWESMPDLDAWITWESWHYRLRDTTQLVSVDEAVRVYRGTPIALLRRTDQREVADAFVRFLLTDEAKGIFRTWGWADPPAQQ